ncbi:SRPBCC family protein [Williamsia sterculiae]|uniref:Polyketide cyclase / dehydrase and lipid transport n=1 Tax=Williamsia sterculiae TaxID=1344003 RepID=A0A1N7H9P1_9NOCA|nr:SRPBCC family protein [Williamsia sterculiae]SIS21605.1 Polyketide cyclase / dehydrase and lipid transport [Williamsia sterculiae]
MTAEVTTVQAGPQKVSRSVQITAPAAELFALVDNPHRHPELDGSGTVRDIPITGPQHLATGDTFTVGMKQYGVPYKITSTATDVQENRVVEWQHPLGHKWRWEFTEATPGITTVVETFDYSSAKAAKVVELLGFPKKNGEGISETLRNLAQRFG